MEMDFLSKIVITVICVLVIVGSVSALKNMLCKYQIATENFIVYKVKEYIINNISNILKPREFFKLKNGGENLCEPIESIEYQDYIGDCNLLFMEIRK